MFAENPAVLLIPSTVLVMKLLVLSQDRHGTGLEQCLYGLFSFQYAKGLSKKIIGYCFTVVPADATKFG